MSITIVLIWLALAVLVGFLAGDRGRSGFGYFALALLLSPAIALIVVFVQPKLDVTISKNKNDLSATKACPYCAETVRAAAIFCKYCKKDIEHLESIDLSADMHKALQDGIYNGDEKKVKAILSTGIDLSECSLPFSHNDYAKHNGTETIQNLLKQHQI